MPNPLRRPAAIALVMAAGLGVASAVGLIQQSVADAQDEKPFTTSAAGQAPQAPDNMGRTGDPRSVDESAARPFPRPLRLSVPALDVAARILPTGVETSGQAEIPPDGDDLGWYEYGVAPGSPAGSAVLIGHRDTVAEGPGALFDLDALDPGDRILVTNRWGTLVYGATARATYDKTALPRSVFDRTGPHRLQLITCGGSYQPDRGGYQENVVVSAELIRSMPTSAS